MLWTWIHPNLTIKKNKVEPALILDKTSGYWIHYRNIYEKSTIFLQNTLFDVFFIFLFFIFLKILIKCVFLRQYGTFFLHSRIPPAASPLPPHLDTVFYCFNGTTQQQGRTTALPWSIYWNTTVNYIIFVIYNLHWNVRWHHQKPVKATTNMNSTSGFRV